MGTDERIMVDGQQRSTTNNKGELLGATEQEIVEFWRWYAGSALIDHLGRPIVLYHGSSKGDIQVFDPEFAGKVRTSDWGKGVYLARSLDAASEYAKEAVSRTQDVQGEALYAEYEKLLRGYGSRPMYEWIDLGSKSDLLSKQRYGEVSDLLNAWREHKESFRQANPGHVYALYAKICAPLRYTYVGITEPFFHETAKDQKKDGILISRERDEDEPWWDAMQEVVVFDGGQLRHAFRGCEPAQELRDEECQVERHASHQA